MKKIGTFATFAISFLLCAISFGQEQALSPIYKDGDFWVFRLNIGGPNPILASNRASGDYLIGYSSGKFEVFLLEGDRKSEAPSGVVGTLTRMLAVSGDEKNDSQFLTFPMSVGKKWSATYHVSPRGKLYWVTGKAEVSGVEEVMTQAGTFRAYKIERLDSGGGSISWRRVYFYSPHVGAIVKWHHETALGEIQDIELMKFGSAGL
jgi:hypothetical protein